MNKKVNYADQYSCRTETNRIIILDSCFSGDIGSEYNIPEYSQLKEGTTILATCSGVQCAVEENGHGVFTSLLVEALYGGAMTLIILVCL